MKTTSKVTANQSNVIASLVKTSQGAVVTKKTVVTLLDIVGFATNAGASALAIGKQDSLIESAIELKKKNLESFNASALSIKASGYILADGRGNDANTKTIKEAFLDSLGDLATTTKQAYYEIFRKVVNSGTKAKGMNKTEGKRDSKADKATGEKAEVLFANVLVALYNHSEFESLSQSTQDEIVAILKAEECLA